LNDACRIPERVQPERPDQPTETVDAQRRCVPWFGKSVEVGYCCDGDNCHNQVAMS